MLVVVVVAVVVRPERALSFVVDASLALRFVLKISDDLDGRGLADDDVEVEADGWPGFWSSEDI